jgi:hypothetical protein
MRHRDLRTFGNKLFFLVVLALLGPVRWITADEESRSTAEPVFAIALRDSKDIPTGFTADRYVRVWERNPFTLVTAVAQERKPSPFDKLFLASWLKDGNKEVVLVQDSETNQLQRITAESNQNNLRLIEIHLDPNPQLVAAILSDGKEQGPVKFRFSAQPGRGQTGSKVPGMPNNGATGQIPNPASFQGSLTKPPESQALGLAAVVGADPSITHRVYPGVPRIHIEGGSAAQVPRPQKIRGNQFLASPVPEQSNPRQN